MKTQYALQKYLRCITKMLYMFQNKCICFDRVTFHYGTIMITYLIMRHSIDEFRNKNTSSYYDFKNESRTISLSPDITRSAC